jgi:hypothetical protein
MRLSAQFCASAAESNVEKLTTLNRSDRETDRNPRF